MFVSYKVRSVLSSPQQHLQLSVRPAAEDPYKESERGFVPWFSPEAGRCVLAQVSLNKPGDRSNKKLYLW